MVVQSVPVTEPRATHFCGSLGWTKNSHFSSTLDSFVKDMFRVYVTNVCLPGSTMDSSSTNTLLAPPITCNDTSHKRCIAVNATAHYNRSPHTCSTSTSLTRSAHLGALRLFRLERRRVLNSRPSFTVLWGESQFNCQTALRAHPIRAITDTAMRPYTTLQDTWRWRLLRARACCEGWDTFERVPEPSCPKHSCQQTTDASLR